MLSVSITQIVCVVRVVQCGRTMRKRSTVLAKCVRGLFSRLNKCADPHRHLECVANSRIKNACSIFLLTLPLFPLFGFIKRSSNMLKFPDFRLWNPSEHSGQSGGFSEVLPQLLSQPRSSSLRLPFDFSSENLPGRFFKESKFLNLAFH